MTWERLGGRDTTRGRGVVLVLVAGQIGLQAWSGLGHRPRGDGTVAASFDLFVFDAGITAGAIGPAKRFGAGHAALAAEGLRPPASFLGRLRIVHGCRVCRAGRLIVHSGSLVIHGGRLIVRCGVVSGQGRWCLLIRQFRRLRRNICRGVRRGVVGGRRAVIDVAISAAVGRVVGIYVGFFRREALMRPLPAICSTRLLTAVWVVFERLP